MPILYETELCFGVAVKEKDLSAYVEKYSTASIKFFCTLLCA